MLIVPYTSTADWTIAMPGTANAPATATVNSFFCMLYSSLLIQAQRRSVARQPLNREVPCSVPNAPLRNQGFPACQGVFGRPRCEFPTAIFAALRQKTGRAEPLRGLRHA